VTQITPALLTVPSASDDGEHLRVLRCHPPLAAHGRGGSAHRLVLLLLRAANSPCGSL